jgi:hypothetical protein
MLRMRFCAKHQLDALSLVESEGCDFPWHIIRSMVERRRPSNDSVILCIDAPAGRPMTQICLAGPQKKVDHGE